MTTRGAAVTPIQAAADAIAAQAQLIRAIASVGADPVDRDAALRMACEWTQANAEDARNRAGSWAWQATTEQIEDVQFHAWVATGILDGVTWPSTGNVWAYAYARV